MEFRLVLLFLVIGCVVTQNQKVCRLEELNMCLAELQNLNVVHSIFKAPMCKEHFDVWKCLTNYSDLCIAEEEKEHFHKEYFEPLQTKIINLCTKVYEGVVEPVEEEHVDPKVLQKALQCLRYTDKGVSQCLSDVISDVLSAALEDDNDIDFFNRTETQCMAVTKMADCIFDVLENKCEEEVAIPIRGGVEKELQKAMELCTREPVVGYMFSSVK